MIRLGKVNQKMIGKYLYRIMLFLLIFPSKAVIATDDTLFVDKPFAAIKLLSAKHLVSAVLAKNSGITAIQANWEASQARIQQAAAFDDPSLTFQIAPQTLGQSDIDVGHKLLFSQRLPWPGKRRLRSDVARYESDASRTGIHRVELRLTHASQFAFANWYYIHAALRINAINQTLLQEFQQIAEIKYSAGRTSKQDVLRAEVEVAMLEHRSIVLQRKRKEILSSINTLLQRQPDLPIPEPEKFSSLRTLATIDKLRRLALDNHPDLRELQATLLANGSRLALAKKNFYPDINLSTGYNSLWNQDKKRFTIGVSIILPLGSKRQAVLDETRADTLALNAEKRAIVAKILNSLQHAFEQVKENLHVLSLYRNRLLPLAEENLEAAQSDYEAGNGSFLNLISAEKNLMQTLLHLEQARADHQSRWANLEQASGGSLAKNNNTEGVSK